MASVLRIALGRCSCTEGQPNPQRQAICRELISQLVRLRARPTSELETLPRYATSEQLIAGCTVSFETIVEPFPEARLIVVKRAFSRSWSRPNWISLQGTGYMFADGFVVRSDGTVDDAPDHWMWDFR